MNGRTECPQCGNMRFRDKRCPYCKAEAIKIGKLRVSKKQHDEMREYDAEK